MIPLSLFHPLAWSELEDAEDAIFWSNAWPYTEKCWAGVPHLFLFSRTNDSPRPVAS